MTEIAFSDSGSQALAEYEATIERGLTTFVEVGGALLAIRDERLYRNTYATFGDYCHERWGFTYQRAHQMIQAATAVSTIVETGLPVPTNEAQARELARVPEPERVEVWEKTIERTGGKPTAAAIREVYQPPASPTAPPASSLRQQTTSAVEADRLPIQNPPQSAPTPPRPEPVMLTLRTHKGDEIPYPKPQAPATFNQSDGEGISWAAWSWNPVTGCLHGCDYCYARAIAARFPTGFPAGFTPLFHHERLDAPANTVIPAAHRDDEAWRRVFVCSMADLYGRWVPDEWIDQVHASMLASPQWQYILLTKFPGRYVGLDLPPRAWVGTSVDTQSRVRIAEDAMRQLDGAAVRWLSLEPLREPLEFTDLSMFDWVVIGAQTETRQPSGVVPAFAPEYDWVTQVYLQAREAGCAVHFKPNLTNGRPGMRMPDEYPLISITRGEA